MLTLFSLSQLEAGRKLISLFFTIGLSVLLDLNLNCCLCLYSTFPACQLPALCLYGVAHILNPGCWLCFCYIWQLCLFSGVSIVLQFLVRMFIFQCLACLIMLAHFLELQRKLQILCLLLCSIFTLNMLNCVILVLVYVLAGYLYFLWPQIDLLLP